MTDRPSNLASTSGDVSCSSGIQSGITHEPQQSLDSLNQATPPLPKKKRSLPGNNPEVIALSPKTLLASNRFICEICNKGFQRYQNLQLHRRGHNLPWKLKQKTGQEVKKKVYVCPEPTCVRHDPSMALGDLTGIKKHFCRKHGEKKWKCERCSKKYAVKSDWRAHMKTCGTREYRCDCGTIFSRRNSFITHRAFCNASAGESARAITATNPLLPSAEPLDWSFSFSHSERNVSMKREQDHGSAAFSLVEKGLASFRSKASVTSSCMEQSNEVGAEGPSESSGSIPKQEWMGNYSSKYAKNDTTFSGLPVLLMPESFSSPFQSTLPSTLYYVQPSLLRELDLSNTNIKTLPKSLPNLVALQKLILKCCDLFMELPPQVGELPNLEELDLNDTEILGLPQEIRKLSKLKYLRVSFYGYMNCGKRLRQNALIHPGTISALSRLAELSIDANPDDERWNAVVEAVIEEACSLKTLECLILYLPNIESLGKRRIGSTSLGYYPLHGFKFTIGQHKQRTICRVPKQVGAHFQEWKRCLKFVKGKDIPIEIKKLLKCTKAFYLDRHASARSLCDFGIKNLHELEFCLLLECNEIQTIVSDAESLEEHAHMSVQDPNNFDPGGRLVFAHQEPHLVNLHYLYIYYLKNLVSICRTPTNSKQCLSGLKFLALHMCPKLSVIFSPDLVANLYKLEVLIVKDCPEVTSVISLTSNESLDPQLPYLPSLKRISLLYLPKLTSISSGFIIATKLENVGFYNCPKLESLSKREMSSRFLEVIKGESKWWEALKWNKSEWGTRLDYIQSIFSPVTTEKDVMTQMEEIRRIPSSHQTRTRDSSYSWMESAVKSPFAESKVNMRRRHIALKRAVKDLRRRPSSGRKKREREYVENAISESQNSRN